MSIVPRLAKCGGPAESIRGTALFEGFNATISSGKQKALIVKTQSIDSRPNIEHKIVEAYRNMTGVEKIKIVGVLTDMTIALTMTGVRGMHPEADEQEWRLRAASHWVDRDLMCKA